MAKRYEVYECEVCGNMVEVLRGSFGQLVCCKQNMKLYEERTEDQGKEKHVPVIEKLEEGFKVTVGSVEHPMTEEHQIEWIELLADDNVYRKYLKADEKPETVFKTDEKQVIAREFCNLHGLWKAEN